MPYSQKPLLVSAKDKFFSSVSHSNGATVPTTRPIRLVCCYISECQRKQNPGLKEECSLEVGESYCIEAANPQPPTDIKYNSAPESAEQPTRTSITGPYAVETLLPTQAGLTKDCQLSHQVDSSESFRGILDKYGLFLRILSHGFLMLRAIAQTCGPTITSVCVLRRKAAPRIRRHLGRHRRRQLQIISFTLHGVLYFFQSATESSPNHRNSKTVSKIFSLNFSRIASPSIIPCM